MNNAMITDAVVATVKASLVADIQLRALFNTTVDTTTDVSRRLTALRGKSTLSTVSVVYSVSFDMDKMQYLDVQDGFSQMKDSFTSAIEDGQFTSTLQSNGGSLAAANGATVCLFSVNPTVTIIQLNYPSMSPTVSCRPTVTPTQLPTTRTPTRVPTTITPSQVPTTIRPTAQPTFRTSEFYSVQSIVFKISNIFLFSEPHSVDYPAQVDSGRDIHPYQLTDSHCEFRHPNGLRGIRVLRSANKGSGVE
jgi:hypothetical protein